MAIVNFSEFAQADLKEIWLYIGEKNLASADKFVDELNHKFQILALNPKIGKLRGDLLVGLHSFPHKKHIIFYFPIEDGVEIYRVIHSSRDTETLFEDYFEGLKE